MLLRFAIVAAEHDDYGIASMNSRMRFLHNFHDLSSTLSESGLMCLECSLDDTSDLKGQLWIKAKLDTHLKGDYHTHASKVKRELAMAMDDLTVTCPICGKKRNEQRIEEHIAKEHPAARLKWIPRRLAFRCGLFGGAFIARVTSSPLA